MMTASVRLLAAVLLSLAGFLSMDTRARAAGPLTLVGGVRLATKAHDVVLQGDFAYVATDAGLTVVDVSDPTAPVVVGAVTPSSAWKSQGVEVAGRWAFLAGQALGLIVVDVLHPTAPRIVATRRTSGGLWDVAVKDQVVYGVSIHGEMYVFDVSSPLDPRQVRVIGLPAWVSAGQDAYNLERLRSGVTSGNAKATGVSMAGNLLLAVDWAYGRLYAFDVSEPQNPVFAGTHYAPYLLKAEANLEQGTVYMLAAYGRLSGLYTLPIAMLSPTAATRYTACTACGVLRSIYAIDQGGLAVVPGSAFVVYAGGRGAGEIHVVNATDPRAMVDAAWDDIGLHGVGLAQTMGLDTRGEYVFLAAGALGLQVYRVPGLSP